MGKCKGKVSVTIRVSVDYVILFTFYYTDLLNPAQVSGFSRRVS